MPKLQFSMLHLPPPRSKNPRPRGAHLISGPHPMLLLLVVVVLLMLLLLLLTAL